MSARSYVYFIATQNLRYVKVGVSQDPSTRLKELQTGNPEPLFLVGAIEGSYSEEAYLHSVFQGSRSDAKNEWFEFRGRIVAFLEWKGILVNPSMGHTARSIRISGWDIFSDDDLDAILLDERIAPEIYYGDCCNGLFPVPYE